MKTPHIHTIEQMSRISQRRSQDHDRCVSPFLAFLPPACPGHIFAPPPYGPGTTDKTVMGEIAPGQVLCHDEQNTNIDFQLSPMRGDKSKTGGAYAKSNYK